MFVQAIGTLSSVHILKIRQIKLSAPKFEIITFEMIINVAGFNEIMKAIKKYCCH